MIRPVLPSLFLKLLFAALVVAITSVPGFAAEANQQVLVVKLDGEVDLGRATLIAMACDEAIAGEAAMLMIEIDSPGGRIDHTDHILAAIEKARASNVRTCALVYGNAWSAAAIIAIACDRLYLSPSSAFGAAQPVFITGSKPEPAGEKYVSAFRTQARAMAERTGRPHLLAQAMVDQDIEILEVEIDGKRQLMTPSEWDIQSKNAYAQGKDAEVLQTVIEKGKLLSLSAKQGVELGMADGIESSREAVLEKENLSGAAVREVRMTWSQHLGNFLTLQLVSMLLLIGGVAGIWVEIKTPGFGFPGILGFTALFLFFFGKYSVGMAEYYEILLFVAGVLLLVVEIFVTPGFGALGTAGLVLMVAGIFLSSQRFFVPHTPEQWRFFHFNIVYTSLSLMGAAGVLTALAFVLPKTPMFRRVALNAPITSAPQTGSAAQKLDPSLMGARGTTETPLRPSGKAVFDGKPMDVVTEGDWVDRDRPVEVVRIDGNRIVVRAQKAVDGRS